MRNPNADSMYQTKRNVEMLDSEAEEHVMEGTTPPHHMLIRVRVGDVDIPCKSWHFDPERVVFREMHKSDKRMVLRQRGFDKGAVFWVKCQYTGDLAIQPVSEMCVEDMIDGFATWGGREVEAGRLK